ncbi:MAG: Eco57I restriction-modification methylase domain-containing protein [Verrucomicrobia bacterium]|nr:Eco57I restriction-modification methylase domain-containing protein [Verrucomicrobiota bacterium]
MNPQQARARVADTFSQPFNKGRFLEFTRNLLNKFDESKAQAWSTQYVKDAFKDHVSRFERLGTYTSPDEESLDVLVVHLTAESKLERARTAIRNFVADHLKSRNSKDAALVAFVSPNERQWRFSYVKMEYGAVETEAGRIDVHTRLTPARRFSYIVGEGESCHTAQTRFLALLQDTENSPKLANIEDAFSVEAVSKEFYKKYRVLFEDVQAGLEKLIAKDKVIRDEFKAKSVNTVDFAKKLMGQIVFLYFLQKKGWLGVAKGQDWGAGPHDFLRRLARGDYGSYGNFFNDVLEPLFYDTLATDRGHEAWCKRFKCRIPFLNGGLFEPLEDYDWRKTDIVLPNHFFTNMDFIEEGVKGSGVLDVFDRYNFTVNEAEPLEMEVAIDPEMLGKVFENLIEENRRKGLGAFYTPREIVHYKCQECLINYLNTALNNDKEFVPFKDIETFIRLGEQISHYEAVDAKYSIKMPPSIEKHARLMDDKLAIITVCDPAVGSGAYPVGMMTKIVRARCALTSYFNDVHERTPYHFKRHSIQNCLYGVDIDPGAVEIAKLRLWLSLVVDEEDVKQIKPLPNLDYKIVTGNSLIGFPFKSQKLVDVEALKKQFFDETDHLKKGKLKDSIERKLQECFAASKKSFGYEVKFDFKILFSEVLDQGGGFDVVIANPPYLGEKGNEDTFRLVAASPWGSRYYKRKMDLFYFFFHLALDIAKKDGSVCFITTSYWITADGALKLRSDLKERATLLQLLHFGELRLFDTAQGQSNMITHLVKNRSAGVSRTLMTKRSGEAQPEIIKSILVGSDPETVYYQISQQQLFDGVENHVRLTPATVQVAGYGSETFNLAKIDSVSRQLTDYAESVFRGVETGCDIVREELIEAALEKKLITPSEASCWRVGMGIYVLSEEELRQLRLTSSEERDCIKPFYKNSDIVRYYTPRKNLRFLLYVDSSTDINLYPNIKKHLEKFRPLLAAREQAVTESHNWFWIRGSKRKSYFYRMDTIIVPYRAESSRFSSCNQDIFGSGDVYYITLKQTYSTRALLGYLNSSLVLYHLKMRGKRKGNIIEYYKNPLEKIPIHIRLLEDASCTKNMERIVDKILLAKQRDANADVRGLEREIDELIYALYGLTPEEIKLGRVTPNEVI